MTAASLLSELRTLGVRLFISEGRLRYRASKGIMTPDLHRQLAAQKSVLLALLACPTCRRPLDDKGRCWKCCNRACAAGCGRQSGSAFLALCLQCEAGCETEEKVLP